jgi:TonB family protein
MDSKIRSEHRNVDNYLREKPLGMVLRASEIFDSTHPRQISKGEGYRPGNASLIPYADNPVPTYPEQARRAGLKGEMMLNLTIDAQGNVVDVKLVKGHEIDACLKQAAFEAVRKWRFIRSDKLEEFVSVTLPVNFNLEA